MENLTVSNSQIVCSAQEYSTKKPLTQGVFTFSTEAMERREILPCDEMRIECVVCEEDTVVFTGTDMQRYGNEEAADFYVWTKEQGLKKLLDLSLIHI